VIFIAPAMAAASSNAVGDRGPVIQEKVNTGNLNLDKEINAFYRCISKTHQDPPTIDIVYSCYYQGPGSIDSSSPTNGITGTDTSSASSTTLKTTTSANHHHHHKHSASTTTTADNSNTIQPHIQILPNYLALNNQEQEQK
jgi:hypothetical protein